jgi:hypothetical protein
MQRSVSGHSHDKHQFKIQTAGDADQETYMARRDQAGEFVFHYSDDTDEVISSIKEICNLTEIGQQFVNGDYVAKDGSDGYEQIVSAAVRVAGGPMLTIGNLLTALTLLIDSGELRPKKFTPAAQLAEPEEDTRARDKNGKVLTSQQIQWGEFRRFAEQASMSEINLRKQSDPEFANFVRKALQAEMNQEIGDAVTPAGEPTSKARVNQELAEFARKYNAEPSQNLKPRGGVVLLAGEQIQYPRFLELVNAATNARLL